MARLSRFILLPAIALVACEAHTSASSSSTASAEAAGSGDDEATAELKEHHRHHHHGGVPMFVAMSLDTLGADEAKRPQIEQLQKDLHKAMEPAREAEKSLLQTVADGVAAGSVDSAKVEAAVGQVATAAADVHGATIDTLNKLHEVLSPSERAALADKVRAHWAVWRKVNHEAETGGREKGGRVAVLAEQLNLTPDQVDKISAALHSSTPEGSAKFDPSKVEAHVEAFATAFASDTFDAKSLDPAGANGQLATHGAERTAVFYETVTPLLTPEQRTKLAEDLREHASHKPPTKGA